MAGKTKSKKKETTKVDSNGNITHVSIEWLVASFFLVGIALVATMSVAHAADTCPAPAATVMFFQ